MQLFICVFGKILLMCTSRHHQLVYFFNFLMNADGFKCYLKGHEDFICFRNKGRIGPLSVMDLFPNCVPLRSQLIRLHLVLLGTKAKHNIAV